MAEPVAEVCTEDIRQNSDDADEGGSNIDTNKCVKLQLAENVAAYLKKEKLVRETKPLTCDTSLVEKVTSNYIIAKQILSNLSWQDKIVCKHVCSTWHSAIQALNKEYFNPEDFVVDLQNCFSVRGNIKFKKSGNFYNEPLAVLGFAKTAGFSLTSKCKFISPKICTPQCGKDHCLLDLVRHQVSLPKECMLIAKANYLSYLPLPQSVTYEHTITEHMFVRTNPFMGGIYIPMLPDVKFHVINVKAKPMAQIQKHFCNEVNKISQSRIVKGVLVYVTENFLLETVEDIVFLNYFKQIQPDIPFAFGGCIVEDTLYDQSDVDSIIQSINRGSNDIVTENLVTIGVFTVPKSPDGSDPGEKYNFNMFSVVIESSEWTKSKIQKAITEFSKKVPHYEHSVVLKLSCVGRDRKHELEQSYFRAAFPRSRLIGCYGNGEIGLNYPARSPTTPQPAPPAPAKRHRSDSGPQFGFMYSYSTVFVYIGWGKIIKPLQK